MFYFWRSCSTVQLQNGSIEFERPDGTTWETDLIILKLIADELRIKHDLTTRENQTLVATRDFLHELAQAYRAEGCEGCTPAMARQIWITSGHHFEKFNKKFLTELQKVR